MLQGVGGQRQNLGPPVARRAGAGKAIWGGERASTTGGPGSDSSTPRKTWGHVPQLRVPFGPKARRTWGRAGSTILGTLLFLTPGFCPFPTLQVPLPDAAPATETAPQTSPPPGPAPSLPQPAPQP